MRENIYYWKCDSPASDEHKRLTYFKDKYERPGLEDMVRVACREAMGNEPEGLVPLRADGNHIAFFVRYGAREYLFRADDGSGDDDYMLAESRVMQLAAAAGVPVPAVHHTDVTRSRCPLRFQVMDRVSEPSLNTHQRAGRLDLAAVALQLGQYLRRLHCVRLEGFGFINTERLARTGEVRGLDGRYPAYFNKRLEGHLGYLALHELLTEPVVAEIRELLRRHLPVLELSQGVLVHRDMAFWNVLGTPHRITAIIDWDDAVSGDPADDLGILHCFHDEAFMDRVMEGYWGADRPPEGFQFRVWLHLLRNMLWKTQIRHALGYFDKGSDFFLNAPGDNKPSLRALTLDRLRLAVERVRKGEAS